ncbi:monofunctional biosynthetic peptidoglycan transglycosylase [Paracoccaceae bacterium Fryx2]|nr:monofunctional biosynthetic peptidoglycan transglycosylase [Paracoccaceae bacterium Fryx2]
MVKETRKKPATRAAAKAVAEAAPPRPLSRRLLAWALRGAAAVTGLFAFLVILFWMVNPPTTIYMLQESARLGGVERDWVDMDEIAPVMARSAVAAEDANFCLHWGFDMAAIRAAVEAGGSRGASTISQQVVKNVFLWHGRSWLRKAAEALITPAMETLWSKRRILEVYLNVAEFGEGVFGVEAAAQHHFGVRAADLTPVQAARLAAVLPDPKGRNAGKPSAFVRSRAAAALEGAKTIRADGRAGCFED